MKRLTFMEKVSLFFGYRYLFNNNTKEVHDIKKQHENCQLEYIAAPNKFYGTKKKFEKLKEFYDGCRWCMKEKSKD